MASKGGMKNLAKSKFGKFTSMERYAQLHLTKRIRQSQIFDKVGILTFFLFLFLSAYDLFLFNCQRFLFYPFIVVIQSTYSWGDYVIQLFFIN
jgi:hypothetical protein